MKKLVAHSVSGFCRCRTWSTRRPLHPIRRANILELKKITSLPASMILTGGYAPTSSRWILQDRGSLVCIQATPISSTCVANPRQASFRFRNLGIYMVADVSMRSHFSENEAACFFILRQLRSIRFSVPRSVLQSLVSVALQRLDYSKSTLAGPSHEADAVGDEFCCSPLTNTTPPSNA